MRAGERGTCHPWGWGGRWTHVLDYATSAAMLPYVIRQGDYLTRLCAERGASAETVWNDPANDEIRQRRRHYDVLLPGDVVHLPEVEPARHSVSPGGNHRFKANIRDVEVQLVLRAGDEAVAGESYTVEGLPEPIEGTTDGEGRVSFRVPVSVREVRLVVASRGWSLPVRVGELDPADEPSGQRQRLEHLGYGGWYGDGGGVGAERDRQAITTFQRDQGIEPTGELDDATRQRLLDVHGS